MYLGTILSRRHVIDIVEKWNVPGSVHYTDSEPVDAVLRAQTDSRLRGYWLGRMSDGQICLVSNQNEADEVSLDVAGDGTPIIRYTDDTTEFSYDGISTIRIKRYS